MSETDLVATINSHLGGFAASIGLRFTGASTEEVAAELEIDERHLQPYGLVHGGVLSAMVETLCSVGAAVTVMSEGKNTVGLENSTSFLRAVRSGVIRGTARAEHRGRRSQVWSAELRDEKDQLIATGRVRLLVLEAGAVAAGSEVRLEPSV